MPLPIGAIRCIKDGGVYRNWIKVREGTRNANDNFMRYSRYLMEKNIGRELLPEEIVHHKNGIPTDDRIENLEIITASEHMSHHLKGKKPLAGIQASNDAYEKKREKLRETVFELHRQGMSLRKMALRLGKDRRTVTKVLQEAIENGRTTE